jgi:hypothetical protein
VTVRPTFTGPAAVPPDLTLALSPATTSQASPGAQVLTATPTGGTGSIASYSWTATYVADGTSAAALLSGSGATRTLTTTTYSTNVLVTVTATDSGSPAQTAPASASVEVGAPPALVPPADLTPTTLGSGTTSQVFTFDPATGGGGTITYALAVESSTGTVTLSTSSGRTATLQGLTDGATVRVTLTATDGYGQSVTADGIYGVAVVPVFDEAAEWKPIGEINFQTLGTGSRSGTGTYSVGGYTFTVATGAGSPTGQASSVSASGLTVSQTSTTGTITGVWMDPALLANFQSSEDILIDFVVEMPPSMTANASFQFGVGDSGTYASGDAYAVQIGQNGSMPVKRTSASTQTNYTMTTQAANYWLSKVVACQILLVGGRIVCGSASEQSTYIAGPLKGRTQPMQGTHSGCAGSASVSTGATIPQTLSAMRIQMAATSNGTTGCYLRKMQFSRLTRPAAP